MTESKRKTGLDFERWVAQAYLSKTGDAKARGLSFDLTLTQYKNMLKAKRCFLTEWS